MSKDSIKADARSDRLTVLRKTNEEVLRKQLQNEASAKCKNTVVDFGRCAQANGIMVAFNCQNENRAMGKCMSEHYTEEKFIEFARERGFEVAPRQENLVTSAMKLFRGK
jgi:hypothetical protein